MVINRSTTFAERQGVSMAKMNMSPFHNAAQTVKQFSDAARLAILVLLLEGARNVGEISEALGMTQPATSHHLALMRYGLLDTTRDGKSIIYSIGDPKRVKALMAFVFPD